MSAPLRAVAEVVANRVEGASRRLAVRIPGWPGFEPGQFVMLSPGAVGAASRDDPLLPRPMAVYRESAPDGIEILYKVVGRGTALLADARPGDRVAVVGPLGHPFPVPAEGRAVLVGGGTGIASLYELAARASGSADVRVLLGARGADDLMGRDDFAALGVELRVATEDGSEGHRGRVTELLDEELGNGAAPAVYACGPTAMMRVASAAAQRAGARAIVSLENPMACGFGVCLGCAAPRADGGFALVCRDGPVFDAADVDWGGLA